MQAQMSEAMAGGHDRFFSPYAGHAGGGSGGYAAPLLYAGGDDFGGGCSGSGSRAPPTPGALPLPPTTVPLGMMPPGMLYLPPGTTHPGMYLPPDLLPHTLALPSPRFALGGMLPPGVLQPDVLPFGSLHVPGAGPPPRLLEAVAMGIAPPPPLLPRGLPPLPGWPPSVGAPQPYPFPWLPQHSPLGAAVAAARTVSGDARSPAAASTRGAPP